MKCITYQSPSGQTINITPKQEREWLRRGEWPRDSHGEEYCSVSWGLHDVTDDVGDDHE